MDYVIPTWHPFVVHFPIVLLFLGGVAAAVYAATGGALWRAITGLAVGLGTLGALAANRTGEALHEQVEGTPIVAELVERHEEFGEWALWAGLAATFVWLGLFAWRRWRHAPADERDPFAFRLAIAVLAVAAGVLVILAGRLGGIMVWGVAA